MKVLLLGANGFLGRFLCRYLTDEGYLVKTVSRKGEGIDYKVDIGIKGDWNKIDFDAEIVINCASVLPGGKIDDAQYAQQLFNTNFWGTYHLCQWVDAHKSVRYVLNASTIAVVNKPWPVPVTENSPTYPLGAHALYCTSKLNQEILLQSYPFSYEVSTCNARLSALYGEDMQWGGVLCNVIDKAIKQEPLSLTNGTKVSADFIYVKDVCLYFGMLIKNSTTGIINIASGKEVFLLDMAKGIYNIVSPGLDVVNTDTNILANRAVVDIAKLIAVEGYMKPTPFAEGLQKTINYRKKQIANTN